MDRRLLTLIVGCLLAARVLCCALGKAIGFQACMQSGMPKIIGMVLATAVLLFAIWVGPKIGMRLESEVLGHVGAAAIFLALAAALLWLGVLQP